MKALHQFVATFEPGATGAHMLEVQRLAREVLGVESELFAEYRRGPHAAAVKHHSDYRGAPGDVLVYHMAIGSVVTDFVVDRPEPLVVDFHNITPAHFIEPWEPAAAYGCAWGRNQLKELAVRADLGVGHSHYSEEELRFEGFAETAVAPLLLDLSSFETDVDAALLDELSAAPGTNWLFVGRLAPNKCQHDLVKALAVYRRLYDPEARLHLVGGSSSDAYVEAVKGFAAELGLADAVRLPGSVPAAQLAAYYKAADVFVSVSEHEGFCVPVVEAMWNRVPVVGFAAAAVPETVGDGGVLLPAKDPATVAAAVARVLAEREAVVEAGSRRLADFDLATTRAQWVDLLQQVGA
ncbi:MAG TPA: glycosyltransferase [Acidimicrobiales bacterium]|nr:glycosyltransferase [Acidimicrobiales bacterium]